MPVSIFDTNRRAAEAMRVPTWLFSGLVYVGFVFLAVGAMAQLPAFGVVAACFGVAMLVIAVRGILAPSRPHDTGITEMNWLMGSSRRLGVFYVLTAAIWIAFSVGVVLGS